MKKSLLALAVAAGSIAVAQAENTTTLYGSVGYGVTTDNLNTSNPASASAKDGVVTVSVDTKKIADVFKNTLQNSKLISTSLGVKGTEDLGNGNQAFFNFKFNVNTDEGATSAFSLSKAYLGFKGGFGTVTFGKQGSAYSSSNANLLNADDVFGGYTDKSFGFGSGISYEAPDFGYGINAKVGYSLTGNFAGLNLGFSQYGIDFNVGGQYGFDSEKYGVGSLYTVTQPDPSAAPGTAPTVTFNGTDGYQPQYVAGASAAYTYDKTFKVAADYQYVPGLAAGTKYTVSYKDANGKDANVVGDDLTKDNAIDAQNLVGLGAEYYLGNNTLRGEVQFDASAIKTQQKYALGYEYQITPRTKTWVEGGLVNFGDVAGNEYKDAQGNIVYTNKKDAKGNLIPVYKNAEYKLALGIKHEF